MRAEKGSVTVVPERPDSAFGVALTSCQRKAHALHILARKSPLHQVPLCSCPRELQAESGPSRTVEAGNTKLSDSPHSCPFSHKCWPGILSRGRPASRPPRILDSSPRSRKAIFSVLPVLEPLFCCVPPLLLLFTPHASQGDCSPLLTTPRKAEMC